MLECVVTANHHFASLEVRICVEAQGKRYLAGGDPRATTTFAGTDAEGVRVNLELATGVREPKLLDGGWRVILWQQPLWSRHTRQPLVSARVLGQWVSHGVSQHVNKALVVVGTQCIVDLGNVRGRCRPNAWR